MSEFIYKVHTCVLPTEFEGLGQGSIWKCDCGSMYELRWTGYTYGSTMTGSAGWGWSQFDKRFWNEAENAPYSRAEQEEIWQAIAEQHRASLPAMPDSAWKKLWKRATAWKFGGRA